MNIRELILEMLVDIGEKKLAEKVYDKLKHNDEADLTIKVSTMNGSASISRIHQEYSGMMLEID